MKRFAFSAAALVLVLGSGSVALAQPPKPAADPAAAQALFYEARNLMRDGKYSLACPKLEESLRLDHGIGTEFNLADCNEKLGKLTTAWTGFLSVTAAARTQNQPQREKVARERAKALEARLPKLTIDIIAPTPNMEIKRDGVVIPSASWGSALPVDPGSHHITATAPGRQPMETDVGTVEGKNAHVSVPQLVPALVAEVPYVVPPTLHTEPAASFSQTPTPFPDPIIERGGPQRTVGWIVSAAGLASLGVGAGFGIDSLRKNERSKDHCHGDICDEAGVSLRDKAMRSGDVATITTIAGGAALLGGLVLVLTAPHSTSHREARSASIRAVPHVAVTGGGISIQGVLP